MAQLVGQACVLCGERVSVARDARFCKVCQCPVHRACVPSQPKYEHCSSCGADPAAMEVHAARVRQDEANHQAILRDHLIKQGVLNIASGLVIAFLAVLSVASFLLGGVQVPAFLFGLFLVLRGILQILRATVWWGRITEKTLSRWAR